MSFQESTAQAFLWSEAALMSMKMPEKTSCKKDFLSFAILAAFDQRKL